jgi:hypothetical protein
MKRLILAISIISLCLLFSCGETPETFKIIYHGGEDTTGFPPTDNNQYKSGEYATVLDQHTLKKEGYEFKGWNTKADRTGTPYSEGDKIEIKNINIFLYATWIQQ